MRTAEAVPIKRRGHARAARAARSVRASRSSAQPTLTSDLVYGERRVGAVALAPSLVSTELAVRDPAIAVSDDVLR
jgi:hypothetical protein